MTIEPNDAACSFCGKSIPEVDDLVLVHGPPPVAICDLCIPVAAETLERREREEIRRKADIVLSAIRGVVAWAEAPDQCSVCHELLDKPENDNSDGELLGHTINCPVAACREILEASDLGMGDA